MDDNNRLPDPPLQPTQPMDQDFQPFKQEAPGKAPSPASTAPLPPQKRRRFWRVALLIALLVAGGLAWRRHQQTASTTDTSQTASQTGATSKRGDRASQQPVGVATVEPRDINIIVNALGTVTPLASVTVVSQISGQLQEVGFTEGQNVKKGDFLAQIDPRPYEALKAQYEGQLAHDQGLLEQARANDIRYKTLLKHNSIARQTAEDQAYVVKQYEGTVRVDQALIDAQALNIGYARIVSPVDGRVGLRLVDPGNYIQASSSTGIAVITQTHPISVIFSVPEDALNKIAPRFHAGDRLVAYAYDRANVKQLAQGVVTTLDNQVDVTTGMVKLRAQFDNQDEALFPNQFVNIRLLVDTLQKVLAAPTAGVQHGAPGDYAYVIDADDKASVRVVKLGPTDGDMVAISSGLVAGDRVVIDGADRLREGASVRVVTTNKPSPDAKAKAEQSGEKSENAAH